MPIGDIHATAETVKDFIADLVFSDDTMVADVVVNRPGDAVTSGRFGISIFVTCVH